MALTSTVYTFDIDLADGDRRLYESLSLRVARHPSESDDYLVARVLAYALEYREGIAFSTGLSTPDEPAIVVRDATGRLVAWIEVGMPDPARLHRAAKAAEHVAVYIHKDPRQYSRRLAGERIHRAGDLQFWVLERTLVDGLVARLERRTTLALSINEREVLVAIGAETFGGRVTRLVPVA